MPPGPQCWGSASSPQSWGVRGAGLGGQHRNKLLTHVLHLLLGHDAGKGEGQSRAGHSLGDREVALAVAEAFPIERLQVGLFASAPRLLCSLATFFQHTQPYTLGPDGQAAVARRDEVVDVMS